MVLAVVCAVAAVLAVGASRGGGAQPHRTTLTPPAAHAVAPSRSDAVRTAAGFLSAMTLHTLLNAKRRDSVLAIYADPSSRPALTRVYEDERTRVAASYRRGPRVARAALVGYRVDGFSAHEATVSVWAASIGGSGTYRPTTGWSTITVDLLWSKRGWRVTNVEEKPGPSDDWPIGSLASEAKTFHAFRNVP
jgi:hypothetical protein